ncbi:hypothetical protein HPP92_016362 [Vanilla planifolia]|uniref:Uncharacterized protein n=1 Tax=Vanilla planifolia TaxID=51239 RepID=A0A835QEM0_VANPL|nr:hypothetical protein HPP92_016362 [Vanilla planifolia]
MVRRYPLDALRPGPIDSLHRGDWVKLICGASFEDAADVRNLSLVYALAGGRQGGENWKFNVVLVFELFFYLCGGGRDRAVDCIDCAADEAVVKSVNDGIDKAVEIASVERPWVMISVNDDKEDIHFRKAGELVNFPVYLIA